MQDLPRRTITAVVYGAAMLLPLVNLYAGLAVMAALTFLGGMELSRLTGPRTAVLRLAVGAQLVLGALALLVLVTRGPGAYLIALLATWAADVGAYVVGSLIGTRKLAATISPGKTWEGTIAGLACAAAVAWSVGATLGVPAPQAALAAVLVGPAGLAGDLVESALKRAAGAKDSGSLLPGHGGVLDRLDSLLLAAPAVVLALAVGAWMG